jgi:pimeloyl-[acyl-carrier protein] methyl ester esterase
MYAPEVEEALNKLHVETTGSGPDLVLLHGWGLHSGVWDGVRGDLAHHFRVHLVELPGYGKSPSSTPFILPEIALAVAKVLPKKVFVCGWSAGAQVALRWALDFPKQVERLVLIAATPRFVRDTDWSSGIEAQVLQEFSADLQRNMQASLKRFISLQTHGGENSRRQSAWLCKHLFTGADPRVLQKGLQILLDTDLREEMREVKQPALLLHGREDKLVPVMSAHRLQQLLARARLEVFEDCAHVPFLAQRAKFVKLVSEFLNE